MSEPFPANILLVDDQESKLLTYEAILSQLGERLIKAHSAKEALAVLLKNEIAVVLLDVSMPEVDGFELADIIRQHPKFENLAIIFVSAIHLSDSDRIIGYGRGAVDYVSVPVNADLLRAKVRAFVELYRKTKQLEERNAELRHLSSKLIAAQDQERRRIARELHDSLGQELTVAKMLLVRALHQKSFSECKKQATDVTSAVDNAIRQVRNMSYLLHPPFLDEMGLKLALNGYIEGLAGRSEVELSINLEPSDFPRLALEVETAIFRIVQESLSNVFRHSGARKAWITLQNNEDHVNVRIQDDGKGISQNVVDNRHNTMGVGLSGIRERAKEFGGELRIRNADPGTIVDVSFPISPVMEREDSPSYQTSEDSLR